MLDFLYNETTYWLLGTAIIFTFVGRYMAFRDHLEDVIAATIESLIEDGYIKTKGNGEELELIKHIDWDKNDYS
jgi:hypothetical protein